MIQASIYAPGGRQSIASAGFVSTRPATILAPTRHMSVVNQHPPLTRGLHTVCVEQAKAMLDSFVRQGVVERRGEIE